jgi:hypothetical protein
MRRLNSLLALRLSWSRSRRVVASSLDVAVEDVFEGAFDGPAAFVVVEVVAGVPASLGLRRGRGQAVRDSLPVSIVYEALVGRSHYRGGLPSSQCLTPI